MIKGFVFLFLFLWSAASFSGNEQKRVVMLISLNPETNRPPLRSNNWNINKKLKKIFYKKLKGRNLDLVVTTFTGQEELRRELLNPDNHAVFWVGHAGRAESFATAGMYDDRGFNMKEIFQEVHQNIKYLGLVGCRSRPFIKGLKSSGLWELNQHLQFYSRDKKEDARRGLKRAIKKFLKFTPKQANRSLCLEKEKLEIHISRSSNRELSAARLLRKGELVGVFSKNQTETVIYLDSDLKKRELKLVLESGAANNVSKDKFNLGSLEFNSINPELKWKLFSNREGLPFGHGSNLYRFSGNINNNLKAKLVLPKQCNSKN